MEVIFTDRFLSWLEKYTDYIALDDIPTALDWSNSIFDSCERLSEQPEIGRIVPEYNRDDIREIILGKYRLIYEYDSNRVVMLTIWHTSQILPR